MGGGGSSRWGSYVRRPTVEEVERIDAAHDRLRDVDAVDIARIPGLCYRRFTCPYCLRSVRYLYAAEGGDWVCARCGGLTYAVRQAPHSPTAVDRQLPGIRLLIRATGLRRKMDNCRYRGARWRRLVFQWAALIDQAARYTQR